MTTETRTTSYRRFWRRLASPSPWWPWGLLPLLGLLLLFLIGAFYVAPRIERDVSQQAMLRLENNAVMVADVESSGQGITVNATGSEGEFAAIHALAKSTQCETWVGELTCPTTVAVNLQAPPVEIVASRPHNFVVAKTADSIVLTGEVPNIATRDVVLRMARERFSDINVVDELRISNESASEYYELAADRALRVVSPFQEGKAQWTNTVLTASGLTTENLATEARTLFHSPEDAPPLGEIEIRVAKDADQCDAEFNKLLTQSSIRFRTASADINAGNETLLNGLAELAGRCPDNLLIAGHTDSMGEADMNQALSLARASSVRRALIDLGVSADRLASKGFGESQPIADNATTSGRARNRRIVISSQEN